MPHTSKVILCDCRTPSQVLDTYNLPLDINLEGHSSFVCHFYEYNTDESATIFPSEQKPSRIRHSEPDVTTHPNNLLREVDDYLDQSFLQEVDEHLDTNSPEASETFKVEYSPTDNNEFQECSADDLAKLKRKQENRKKLLD